MEGKNLVFIRGSISAFKCKDWENLHKMSDFLRRDLDIGPLLHKPELLSLEPNCTPRWVIHAGLGV